VVPKYLEFRRTANIFVRLIRTHARYFLQRIWVGKDERSPVESNEFVLRRIHKNNYDGGGQS